MKAAAVRVHALMYSLGLQKAEVVGHDIGLMVAYAYAAMHPAETTKLVVMDAFLPGVAGLEAVYNNPDIWHFRFNGPTPEALVRRRERIYLDYFWNDFAADKTRSIPGRAFSRFVESLRGSHSNIGLTSSSLESIPRAQPVFEFRAAARPRPLLREPLMSVNVEDSIGDAPAVNFEG